MSKLAVGDLLWDEYYFGMIIAIHDVKESDLAIPDGKIYVTEWYTVKGEMLCDYSDGRLLWRWKSNALKLEKQYEYKCG